MEIHDRRIQLIGAKLGFNGRASIKLRIQAAQRVGWERNTQEPQLVHWSCRLQTRKEAAVHGLLPISGSGHNSGTGNGCHPTVMSTLRKEVEVTQRAPRCRVKEVIHKTHHTVVDCGTSNPASYLIVGELEQPFTNHPEISMVPVTGFGWIDLYEKRKHATTQSVSDQAHGLCVFLARVDTTAMVKATT